LSGGFLVPLPVGRASIFVSISAPSHGLVLSAPITRNLQKLLDFVPLRSNLKSIYPGVGTASKNLARFAFGMGTIPGVVFQNSSFGSGRIMEGSNSQGEKLDGKLEKVASFPARPCVVSSGRFSANRFLGTRVWDGF
jgi:hypothetical protein